MRSARRGWTAESRISANRSSFSSGADPTVANAASDFGGTSRFFGSVRRPEHARDCPQPGGGLAAQDRLGVGGQQQEVHADRDGGRVNDHDPYPEHRAYDRLGSREEIDIGLADENHDRDDEPGRTQREHSEGIHAEEKNQRHRGEAQDGVIDGEAENQNRERDGQCDRDNAQDAHDRGENGVLLGQEQDDEQGQRDARHLERHRGHEHDRGRDQDAYRGVQTAWRRRELRAEELEPTTAGGAARASSVWRRDRHALASRSGRDAVLVPLAFGRNQRDR